MSMIETLKKQIPNGLAWLLPPGYMRGLVEGLAQEPQRIKDFLEGVVTESNPGTAIHTQEEWFQQYGIFYDSAGSLAAKQATTLERYIALGAQDIVYFQDQVDKAGFNEITISENAPGDDEDRCGEALCGEAVCSGLDQSKIFEFIVSGSVNTDADFNLLAALVQRISPAHCHPSYDIDFDGFVCGDALCGEAICSFR